MDEPPTHPAVAVLGSARAGGNTERLLARLTEGRGCTVHDLFADPVAPFRYDQVYEPDSFLETIERMTRAPVVIFATPIYWYSYSTSMKVFIDRLSDLLKSQKRLGRGLRGRTFALLTSSGEPRPDPAVVSSFERLCAYLGAEYAGCVHGHADGEFHDRAVVERIRGLMPIA